MKKHIYFRVYPDGSRAPSIMLTESDKNELVEYNKIMRFGCAQFVDGKCVFPGKVPADIILSVEKESP